MMWDDTVETLIALGRLDEAGALLAQFDDLAARSSRWARAAAARCHALLALALGDDAGAVAACDRALAEEGGTYPIERGRIMTTLGAAHRHARRTRAAREVLGAAVELLDGMGAVTWRDAAAAELGRVSGRRAHGDELTPRRATRRGAGRRGPPEQGDRSGALPEPSRPSKRTCHGSIESSGCGRGRSSRELSSTR